MLPLAHRNIVERGRKSSLRTAPLALRDGLRGNREDARLPRSPRQGVGPAVGSQPFTGWMIPQASRGPPAQPFFNSLSWSQ
jgi:hypothetical protein